MCNGIAIIVTSEPKVYAISKNGSHDKVLHDLVPIDLHNSCIKIEYVYPGSLHLDCPDKECIGMATKTGLIEIDSLYNNIARIKPFTMILIANYIWNNPIEFIPQLMQEANLKNADLNNADLNNANLRYANLKNADLNNADLNNANLNNADLRYANLKNADLNNANLRYADLNNADLNNANLNNADLRYANLSTQDKDDLKERGAILSYKNGGP